MKAESYPDPWEGVRPVLAAAASLSLLIAAFAALQLGLLGPGQPARAAHPKAAIARTPTRWTPSRPPEDFTVYIVSNEAQREALLRLLDDLNQARGSEGLAPYQFDILVIPAQAPAQSWMPLLDTWNVRLDWGLPLVIVDNRLPEEPSP